MDFLRFIRYFVLLLSFLLVLSAESQDSLVAVSDQQAGSGAMTVFESLVRGSMLQMTLKTDTRKLVKEKMKEKYQEAMLSYEDGSGKLLTRKIEVKTRGNLRLKRCQYPPIRIKFAKEDVGRDGLMPPRRLKVVSCCESGPDFQQLVLREYLVYKLFKVLSDNGFNVQLVNLRIEDTNGKDKPRDTYAFLIEDEDEMARRMGGEIYDPMAVTVHALHSDAYDLLAMFQFIIGNTDWFVLNKHNVKFVLNKEEKTLKAVPYDFDYAGLVNAPYAVTNVKMPITNVRERFFIGMCRDDGAYDSTIQYVLSKKSEMLAVIEECKELSFSSRTWATDFLTQSFEILEDPKWITREIAKGCDWSPLAKK